MSNTPLRSQAPKRHQSGMSLLEILVALSIGFFLLTGIITVFSATRQNFTAQGQMSQLQDDQRMAMGIVTTILQEAGFFPAPQTTTVAVALPVAAPFTAVGQSVSGVNTAGAPDTLTVRYLAGANGGDSMTDCNGNLNTTGSTVTFVNTFAINANKELTCSVNSGNARPLVGGITGLAVLFGVDSDGNGSVNQYLPASGIAATAWPGVLSALVTMTFQNPLAGQPGQNATISLTRVISLMGKS